jgi:recombining binding protein (suppressor of hairless)
MSIDFNSHPLYPQPDLDAYSLHNSDPPTSSPTQNRLPQPHSYDHGEPMEVNDQPNYNLFPNSAPSASFGSQRYRSNASSSPSLNVSYGMNGDPVYSQTSFGESVPAFNTTNSMPYDMMDGSGPSSYGSGKASPLTPNDQVGISHPSTFQPLNGGAKDYSQHGYTDITHPPRRYSNASAGPYQPDYQDNYGINGVSGGLPFSPNPMPPFQERMGGFQSNGRFPHSNTLPTVPSHISSHGHDILHGVPPQATHGYRSDGSVPGYDDPSRYLGPNPHADMSLRMPNVDETLVRMKLQSVSMGSTDLQTFIRLVRLSLLHLSSALIVGSDHTWINMFARSIV